MSIQKQFDQARSDIDDLRAEALDDGFGDFADLIGRFAEAFAAESLVIDGSADIGTRTVITDRILNTLIGVRLEYRNIAMKVSPEFEKKLERAQTDIFAVLGHPHAR